MNSIAKLFKRKLESDTVEDSQLEQLNINELPSQYPEQQIFDITPIAVTDVPDLVLVERSELEAVTRDLTILTEMARDINGILDVQQEQIETIEENIERSETNIIAAQQEVSQAIKYSKSSKYKKGAIATTACAATGGAIGMVGGPIGAVIGAGIGGAVGIVGSTVSSML